MKLRTYLPWCLALAPWFAIACSSNDSSAPPGAPDAGGEADATRSDGGGSSGRELARYEATDLGDACMFERTPIRLYAPTNDELVVVGLERPCGHNDNIWLGRIGTKDGALRASSRYNGPENFRDIGYDAVRTGDGSWAVVGVIDFQNSSPQSGRTWFGAVDTSGVVTTHASYPFKGLPKVDIVPSGYVLTALDQGNAVIVGVDSRGAERWRVTRPGNVLHAMLTRDGSTFVAGTGKDPSSSFDKAVGMLLRIDATGKVAWERYYDPDPARSNAPSYFQDMSVRPDGTVVVAGFERDATPPKFSDTGVIAEYDGAGNRTSLQKLPGTSIDAFAIDPRNGEIVARCSDLEGRYMIIKRTAGGEERWRMPLDSMSTDETLAVAPDGTIWTTIMTETDAGALRHAIVGYAP